MPRVSIIPRDPVRSLRASQAPEGARRRTQRGGAALWIVLALLLGLGLLYGLQRGLNSEESPTGLQDAGQGETQAAGTPESLLPLEEPEDDVSPVGRVEAEPLPYRNMPRSFDGQGEISGEVFPAPDQPFPSHWTLRIRPSQFASGKEKAISKDLEFEGAQTTFEVRDLPMASYSIQVTAEGQASRPVEVSLFRIEGGAPGASKERSHIMLRFEPLSEVRVELRDALQQPVRALPLVLEARATRERWTAQTDALGRATIADVPEGLYQLFVGDAQTPHLPPVDLKVLRTEPTEWQGELPPTQSITLRVVDHRARVLPDAVVRGHGPVPIDVRTDQAGEVLLPYLPFGRYQIRGEHAASEAGGRMTVEIPLVGPDATSETITLHLR